MARQLKKQMRKLAIITTHPIQYYAPVFKLLQQRAKIELKVFYTLGWQEGLSHDPGFGKTIRWDIPLLDGYPHEWMNNIAATPGSNHFKGIVNPDLIDKINSWLPDAILVYGWAYHGHLKAIRYFKNRIPIYFRGDSTLLNESLGFKKILKTIFLRWVYRHINHAFYVGKNNKAYFMKYGLNEKQLTFAPHAVDNERFNKSRVDEARKLRSSLKIKDEDMLILFAGKFEPVKNVELLLSSFIKLNRQNVHLLLVGNGMNEAKLKSQANSSRLAGNIHFLDFKNQTIIDALDEVAAETGKSVAQVAINWVLQRPTVVNIVIGARNEEQLKQNLDAVGWNLTTSQIKKLDAASEVPPIYPYWHQRQDTRLNPLPKFY
ncbi:MAG: glycosyl transferase family 1 [Mucilaginibacter sp.]|nr:glycosyl transferase family 1 [Mucilaginibacter sp.]